MARRGWSTSLRFMYVCVRVRTLRVNQSIRAMRSVLSATVRASRRLCVSANSAEGWAFAPCGARRDVGASREPVARVKVLWEVGVWFGRDVNRLLCSVVWMLVSHDGGIVDVTPRRRRVEVLLSNTLVT